MKYVKPLSTEAKIELETAMKQRTTNRFRNRVHSILLSAKGYQIKEIVAILGVGRDTVSVWFDKWACNGLEGLKDRPRCGRPSKLNAEQKKSFRMGNGEPSICETA